MGRCTLSITDVVRVVACRLGGVQNAVRPILQNVMVQSSEKFTAFQVRSPWQAPFSLEFKSLQNHLWKDTKRLHTAWADRQILAQATRALLSQCVTFSILLVL